MFCFSESQFTGTPHCFSLSLPLPSVSLSLGLSAFLRPFVSLSLSLCLCVCLPLSFAVSSQLFVSSEETTHMQCGTSVPWAMQMTDLVFHTPKSLSRLVPEARPSWGLGALKLLGNKALTATHLCLLATLSALFQEPCAIPGMQNLGLPLG